MINFTWIPLGLQTIEGLVNKSYNSHAAAEVPSSNNRSSTKIPNTNQRNYWSTLLSLLASSSTSSDDSSSTSAKSHTHTAHRVAGGIASLVTRQAMLTSRLAYFITWSPWLRVLSISSNFIRDNRWAYNFDEIDGYARMSVLYSVWDVLICSLFFSSAIFLLSFLKDYLSNRMGLVLDEKLQSSTVIRNSTKTGYADASGVPTGISNSNNSTNSCGSGDKPASTGSTSDGARNVTEMKSNSDDDTAMSASTSLTSKSSEDAAVLASGSATVSEGNPLRCTDESAGVHLGLKNQPNPTSSSSSNSSSSSKANNIPGSKPQQYSDLMLLSLESNSPVYICSSSIIRASSHLLSSCVLYDATSLAQTRLLSYVECTVLVAMLLLAIIASADALMWCYHQVSLQ